MVTIAGLEFTELPAIIMTVLALVVAPAATAVLAGLMVWRRQVGGASVRRELIHDSTRNRVAWRLVVTALHRPVPACTISFGGETLNWEGSQETRIDIGPGGAAQAIVVARDYDAGTKVQVRSGMLTIFHKRFESLPELSLNSQTGTKKD
ncbi:MAG TPA: hypothetical protein VIB07_05635 [Nitrososphaera sp.]|jgi:hypothetical protein